MGRIMLAVVGLALCVGCGGDDTDAAAAGGGGREPGGACAPGELAIEDGSCRPAGMPPDLPAAGPTATPQAGVPDGACYDGFASDGEAGCTAIVPSAPCAGGMMAIPGDTACREVAPCGSGTWGLIPLEPGAEFVDASFSGQSDGSIDAPWQTVQDAIDAAAPGDMVAIAAGTYDESLVIDGKAVRLWGVCPALVEIAGVTPMGRVTEISALGSEVHTLALTGFGTGVAVLAPGGVLLDRLWIHDTSSAGVFVRGGGEATQIGDSLIERTPSAGIIVEGSSAVVERTEVNDPQLWSDGFRGMAIHVVPDPDTNAPSAASISLCHFHDNKDFGILNFGSTLEVAGTLVHKTKPINSIELGWGLFALDPASSTLIEGSVFAASTGIGVAFSEGTGSISTTTIEDTEALAPDGYAVGLDPDLGFVLEVSESTVRDNIGRAVSVHGAEAHLTRVLIQRTAPNLQRTFGSGSGLEVWELEGPSSVELDECIIEESVASGVWVSGSDLVMRESLVRATDASPLWEVGIGLGAQRGVDTGRPASVSIVNSLIEQSTGHGLTGHGVNIELVSSIVRDTRPSALGDLGIGVAIASAPGVPAQGRIYGSVVEQCHQVGIVMGGSELDIEATVVRDVLPEASSNGMGRGLHVENDDEGRSSLMMRWSLIEDVHESGIFTWSSDVELRGVLVRNVTGTAAGQAEGFGVAATAGAEGIDPSRMVIVGSHIEHAVAAGIIADASEVSVTATRVNDIAPRAFDGHFGYGIFAQHGSRADVIDSLVERTLNGGITAVSSSISVENTTVRDVLSSDGYLGDGILVALSDATLRNVLVERPQRAGVSAFGGSVTMSGVELLCAAIDVDVETDDGVASQFSDQGDNLCGCPMPDRACVAASAGVAAPEAIGPVN